jgi:hypothetical protein
LEKIILDNFSTTQYYIRETENEGFWVKLKPLTKLIEMIETIMIKMRPMPMFQPTPPMGRGVAGL